MYYYVDFENVKSAGMKGVENLTENDTVVVFYSEEKCRLTFELLKNMLTAKAKLEFFEVTVVSANSLDFQLSTKLGYDVAEHPDEKFVIISEDKGFKPVTVFWQSQSAEVYLFPQIKLADRYINSKECGAFDEEEEPADVPDEETYNKLLRILEKYRNKQSVHTALMKEVGGAKATALYHAVKSLVGQKAFQTKTAIINAMLTAEEQIKALSDAQNEPRDEPSTEPAAAQEELVSAPEEEESAAPEEETAPPKKKAGRPKKEKAPALSGLIPQYKGDVKRVEEIIGKYKTKLGVSRALAREYGEVKAETIYSLIMPLIKDKKGKDADM